MKKITKGFLRKKLDHIFVFGDNTIRLGHGGAAVMRDEPNTYGFITKRYPNNRNESFYKPDEYKNIFEFELNKLIDEITLNPNKIFMISKLGGELANRYGIWEQVIKPGLERLKEFENVIFLYEE